MPNRRSPVFGVILGAAIAVTVSAQTPKPAFDVTSVKSRGTERVASPPAPVSPTTFHRSSDTVVGLVQFAYNIVDFQAIGGPEWIRQDRFEINAKTAGAIPTDEQMRLMVQSLLEDRFKLMVRRDQQEMRTEQLVLARDGRVGPKLEKCDDPAAVTTPKPFAIPPGSYPFIGRCKTMSSIAANISVIRRALVVDKTELPGFWTYQLVYAQEQPLPPGRLRDLADEANLPTFAAMLQNDLGLRLVSGRGPVDVLLIESVQKPTEN